MERENFYIILNLSTRPPESDPVIIEETIKKKQAEWSRLRNHPSKGIKAQQYIGMISEIRKVMLDPSLREKEARSALEIMNKEKARKHSGIDRHLEILMSKGFIKDEEIVKLAKHHKVAPSQIRSRIHAKEKEKFAALDSQIDKRMKKGFISEAEITALAKIHGLNESVVRSRVSGPIKKEKNYKIRQSITLDPSIKKLIEENLKIVGKKSLYDFLGMETDAEISKLQERSKEKEVEVLKARKKDAIATASGVLVGQCMSLFKNDRNRAAYDATRAQSKLSELDSDIEVAGIERSIRIDNFELLVGRAVELGMDPGSAAEYIKNYCKKKNWRIENTRKNRKSKKRVLFRFAVFLALLAAGAYQGNEMYEDFSKKKEYEQIIDRAEGQEELDDKISVLKNYLFESESHKYTPIVREKYKEYLAEKESMKLDSTLTAANSLIQEDKLDNAMNLYLNYLEKHPNSGRTGELKKKISELERMMERKDYKALEKASNLGTAERIAEYNEYLGKYPSGEGRQDVLNLLKNLGEAYYVTLMDDLAECEKRKQYEKCLRFADTYIEAFPEDSRSRMLRELQIGYRKKLGQEMVLQELRRKAAEKTPDFTAARKIYENYLRINPDSSLKDRVLIEIEKVEKAQKQAEIDTERRLRAAKLKATGGRFISRNSHTVSDERTGLMWTMWDSTHTSEDCLDYEAAHRYVENLRAGGHDDWRIPTPDELAGIYKSEPFFPFHESEWYWTSVSYKRYSEGWISMVEVVDTQKETVYHRKQIDSRRCGAARAVRP